MIMTSQEIEGDGIEDVGALPRRVVARVRGDAELGVTQKMPELVGTFYRNGVVTVAVDEQDRRFDSHQLLRSREVCIVWVRPHSDEVASKGPPVVVTLSGMR